MLAGGYSFRLFFYVEFAIGIALLIATFFLVPETAYKRKVKILDANSSTSAEDLAPEKGLAASSKPTDNSQIKVEVEGNAVLGGQRKSYLASLNPWSGIDHEAEFFMMIVRSFSYYLVPHVLWVITSFGMSSEDTFLPSR